MTGTGASYGISAGRRGMVTVTTTTSGSKSIRRGTAGQPSMACTLRSRRILSGVAVLGVDKEKSNRPQCSASTPNSFSMSSAVSRMCIPATWPPRDTSGRRRWRLRSGHRLCAWWANLEVAQNPQEHHIGRVVISQDVTGFGRELGTSSAVWVAGRGGLGGSGLPTSCGSVSVPSGRSSRARRKGNGAPSREHDNSACGSLI